MAANKKDICVIGMGRFGTSVVEQLTVLKSTVLALDINEAKLTKASRIASTAIVDATDLEALRALGLEKFNTVIVATTDNIEIVAALIELGVKHIITEAKSTAQERVLKQIGVDVIVKPDVEAGIRTALIATNSNFIKYSELLQEVGDGYAIGSTLVNDIHWIGKPLSELRIGKLGVSVVSIKRGTKVLIPNGDTRLRTSDLITLIGKVADLTGAFAQLNDGGKNDFVTKARIEKKKIESAVVEVE